MGFRIALLFNTHKHTHTHTRAHMHTHRQAHSTLHLKATQVFWIWLLF